MTEFNIFRFLAWKRLFEKTFGKKTKKGQQQQKTVEKYKKEHERLIDELMKKLDKLDKWEEE